MPRGTPSKTLVKCFISVATGTSPAVVIVLGRRYEIHVWMSREEELSYSAAGWKASNGRAIPKGTPAIAGEPSLRRDAKTSAGTHMTQSQCCRQINSQFSRAKRSQDKWSRGSAS